MPDLSPRQRDGRHPLAAGRSDGEAAADLGAGVRTVETHPAGIRLKPGATNRAEAAALGIRLGLA